MSRKSLRSTTGNSGKRNNEPETKQRVFLMPNNILNEDINSSSFLVQLRHPKTGKGSLYLFNHDDTVICEVLKYEEKPRSWFLGNYVQRDGSLYICTEMNALFLVLHYLSKVDKFVLLDQILQDDEFPECPRLLSCKNLENIHRITDSKNYEGQTLIKFNHSKTLEWLKNKIEKIIVNLKESNVNVGRGYQLSTFKRSKNDEIVNHDDYLRYACGILSEYLDPQLSKDLEKYLNLETKNDSPSKSEEEPPTKRAKLSTLEEPTENYSTTAQVNPKICKETKKLSQAQRALSKVDKTGMKNISSFFAKPKK